MKQENVVRSSGQFDTFSCFINHSVEDETEIKVVIVLLAPDVDLQCQSPKHQDAKRTLLMPGLLTSGCPLFHLDLWIK